MWERPTDGAQDDPACWMYGIPEVGWSLFQPVPPATCITAPVLIENSGARRYRLKLFNTLVPIEVHVQDKPFVLGGVIWQDVVLGNTVAVAGGFRGVFNFGEGTGAALYIGPRFSIMLCNASAVSTASITRFELWVQV